MRTSYINRSQRRLKGFTLLEALLLIVVLGISVAAVGRALTAMAKSPEQNNKDLDVETSILDKMEYLRSRPFTLLAADANKASSVFTDNPVIDGDTVIRSVNIIYVNPTTGASSGAATHMLQISVSIGTKTVYSWENEP